MDNKPIELRKKRVSGNRAKAELKAILYIVPFLIPFALFYLWPVLRGTWISLHVWNIQGMQRYVALDNYKRIFENSDFYKYLWNSFYFVIIAFRRFSYWD